MGERRFFGLDPEEILGLEEAVYQVLHTICSKGFLSVQQRLHVNVCSNQSDKETDRAYDTRARRATKGGDGDYPPRIANKYGQYFKITVTQEECDAHSGSYKTTADLLTHRWPLIHGMSVHTVGTYVAKRINQLLMMSHALLLKVDEFGCEYWYVYKQGAGDVKGLR